MAYRHPRTSLFIITIGLLSVVLAGCAGGGTERRIAVTTGATGIGQVVGAVTGIPLGGLAGYAVGTAVAGSPVSGGSANPTVTGKTLAEVAEWSPDYSIDGQYCGKTWRSGATVCIAQGDKRYLSTPKHFACADAETHVLCKPKEFSSS